MDQLQYSLDDSKTELSNEVKEAIKNNILKFKKDIKTLGNNFETEKEQLSLFSKYNNQVINIRKQFSVSKSFFDSIYFYTHLQDFFF